MPLSQPRSCRQQKALSSLTKDGDVLRSWPFNFHSDQNLESLLSVGGLKDRLNESARPYFSVEELRWYLLFYNHFERASVLIKVGHLVYFVKIVNFLITFLAALFLIIVICNISCKLRRLSIENSKQISRRVKFAISHTPEFSMSAKFQYAKYDVS